MTLSITTFLLYSIGLFILLHLDIRPTSWEYWAFMALMIALRVSGTWEASNKYKKKIHKIYEELYGKLDNE